MDWKIITLPDLGGGSSGMCEDLSAGFAALRGFVLSDVERRVYVMNF